MTLVNLCIKVSEWTDLISVGFILDKRMDQQSTEEKIRKIEPWQEAINGPNPYILPFPYEDYNWKCMHCALVFDCIAEHWHEFHSETGPKKQPYMIIG